jgi:hypothetical protein
MKQGIREARNANMKPRWARNHFNHEKQHEITYLLGKMLVVGAHWCTVLTGDPTRIRQKCCTHNGAVAGSVRERQTNEQLAPKQKQTFSTKSLISTRLRTIVIENKFPRPIEPRATYVVSTFKFPRLYFSNRKCGNMGKIHKT